MRRLLLSSLACSLCSLIACSSDPEATTSDGWQGNDVHLAIHGLLNGEKVDVSLTGDAVADGTVIWCERDYQAPTVDGAADLAHAMQTDTTVAGYATVGGEERFFELELMGHTFQAEKPGTELTIVPRVDDVELEGDEMWLEWEWTTLDGEDLLESAAQEGSFVLEEFTGKPGDDGAVIPEGKGSIGGYAEARWSVDEKLSISFTVPCTVNDVEEL